MSRIRQLERDDLPSLFDDLRTRYRFNPLIIDQKYFDWQFLDQDTQRYNAYVAWENKRPVGFVGFQHFTLVIEGREWPATFPMNWFAEYRDGTGMHLFRAMMAQSSAQVMLLATPKSQGIFQSMGMICKDHVPRCLGFLAPALALTTFDIKNKGVQDIAHKSYEVLTNLANHDAVVRVKSFDPDREYLSVGEDVVAFPRRRGSDLNWRYVTIPHHAYQLIEGKDGMAVWRIEKIMDTDMSVARILEWTFPSTGIEAETAMSIIVSDGIAENVILLDFFCTALDVCRRLEALGFYSTEAIQPAFIPWLFRPLNFNQSLLVLNSAINFPRGITLDTDKVYLTRGDTDADRSKL